MRWRLAEPRYPDSDWQEAFWLVIDLLPGSCLNQLTAREDVYTQFVSALTQQDSGQSLLSQIVGCAERQVHGEPINWPDMSALSEAVNTSEFSAIAKDVASLCAIQQARLDRLDRESGMVEDIRRQWNTMPLLHFLTLAQELPAAPDGAYSESGGLGTLITDALQVAVRIRKSSALPPDEPEEQMRQGEAWNTATWFMVLFLGLQRLYHMQVFCFRDLSWQAWRPDMGPLPPSTPYRSHFEHTPDAAARSLPVLFSLMPAGMLSWFRPFPLLYRAFTGALTGHESGQLVRRMAEEAIRKASEQWLRDRGLPVTPDAVTLNLHQKPVPPAPMERPQAEPPAMPVPVASTATGPAIDTAPEQDSPLSAMLDLMASVSSSDNAIASPTYEPSPGEPTTAGENGNELAEHTDDADAFVSWLRDGLAGGTLAINTPDALVHVWSPGFVFVEYPAIVQRWSATCRNTTEERDKLWRSVQRHLRNSHFFQETDGGFPEGRVVSEDGSFRNVKGHLISPGKLFSLAETPPPGRCFTLRKKKV